MNELLIDTHSHLYDEAFDGDRAEVMARAVDTGVGKIILPAIDSATHERLLGMCGQYPDICYPLMGLHPTSVNDNPHWQDELRLVEKLLRESPDSGGVKFYGVGEVGLDLHWSRDFLKEQETVFRRQIELALEFSLPLVIHTREAWNEMRTVLGSYRGSGLRGIMHSFSGTMDDYEYVLGCGDFMFGIGGPVTYKKSALADILPFMDISRIVLETDSPYLPPVPFRGKRNESPYLVYVCGKVAEIKGVGVDEVARVTTENAERMFGLPAHDNAAAR